MKTRLNVLLLVILAGVFSASAERNVIITVPVLHGLTEEALPDDFMPAFDICNAADSTIVEKSKVCMGNSRVIGVLTTNDEKGKFLIHVYVNKKVGDGTVETSDDFQDAWLDLNLAKIKKDKHEFKPVYINARKVSRNDVIGTGVDYYER